MKDCFPGVKYRKEGGGIIRKNETEKEADRKPMGPDIHLTDSDRYGSKKVVCGTFINRGSRADIISLPATLRQLL